MAVSRPRVLTWLRWVIVTVLASGAMVGGLSWHYHVPLPLVPVQVARVVVVPTLGRIREADARAAQQVTEHYRVGRVDLLAGDAEASWRRLGTDEPGFRLLEAQGAAPLPAAVPFVYESAAAPYLRELVETYALHEVVAGAPDEYRAMLRLGGWVGQLFDHGADELGRRQEYIPPVDVIRAGAQGRRFWCEVAARLTVHAATALGWQARLATASRNGYVWEHAVAELWSNQFRKWFVLDTDFNLVYEVDGIPQSAFELCKDGMANQAAGRLGTRAVAPQKPSLPSADLMPFYAYIHVDMRNDWNSRHLQPGSPAGGDLSTWWTARPGFGPLLTAKVRTDEKPRYDWAVNAVSLYAGDVRQEPDGSRTLGVGLVGYSPAFRTFQTAFDAEPWGDLPAGHVRVPLLPGTHTLRARVVTENGGVGPEYAVTFEVTPTAG